MQHQIEENFYSAKNIMSILKISRSTISLWSDTRNFPKPIKVSNRLCRWDSNKVDKWIEQNFGKSMTQQNNENKMDKIYTSATQTGFDVFLKDHHVIIEQQPFDDESPVQLFLTKTQAKDLGKFLTDQDFEGESK